MVNATVLDARKHGSVQSRRRLFVVAVRKDVAAKCGEFVFPSPLATTATLPGVASIFGPVPLVQSNLTVPAVYTPVPQRTHETWYRGPTPVGRRTTNPTIG